MKRIVLPKKIGAEFGGGFYAGLFRIGEHTFANIVAPKSEGGENEAKVWTPGKDLVKGALSYCDGRANTLAMARAGSEHAKWARSLRIGGFKDWHIGARDQNELLYRHFKPGTYTCHQWRSGDNPSSVPPGFPYTPDLKQTSIKAFQTGGPEAFAEEWYWTSTQYAPDPSYAWAQHFNYGNQLNFPKVTEFRARAVRSIQIS